MKEDFLLIFMGVMLLLLIIIWVAVYLYPEEEEKVKIKFNLFKNDYNKFPHHWRLRYDYVIFIPTDLRVEFNFIGKIRYRIWQYSKEKSKGKVLIEQKYCEMMKIIKDENKENENVID